MSLTAKLAFSQIKINRNRSAMTLLGIALSSAMLTAVYGFVESARLTLYNTFGFENDAQLPIVIIIMGVILGVIIVAASVIVVSNAFRVSANERVGQFGILKSVGATKNQIAKSVLYEGVFLSIIGIPVGIAIGLLIDLIGTSIITDLMHSLYEGGTLNVDSEDVLTTPFTAPPLMFIVATLTSFGTVLISAWLPARKAAKIPAIDAIRGVDEVKLKSKNVRVLGLAQLLFGFEGALAAKSLKRSRRSFRATVVSLTISIVMLITASSFGSLMEDSINLMFMSIDATVVIDWSSDIKWIYDDEGYATDYVFIPLSSEMAETVTEKLREYNNAGVYGSGTIGGYKTVLPNGTEARGKLITVDKKHYRELCKKADVPVGSSLLVNIHYEASDGKRKEYTPHKFSDFKDKIMTFTNFEWSIEVIINGELTGNDVPNEIGLIESDIIVIVPDGDSSVYNWYVKVDDIDGFIEYSKQVLSDYAPQSTEDINVNTSSMDIAGVMRQMQNLVDTVMFFVYGFVGMLTLIAATSVISTINTNIRSRAHEFAVLKSVGMTKSGIGKMLNLESILCSVRSLIFGLPLGILCSLALHKVLGGAFVFPFEFPWLSITECLLGVFVVTWITMRYSASRLKKENIVEAIRRK